ncbi:VOC family protein [Bdellovibrio sp. BCCA]|uniref:VOC family protein n=1 Tax=Bdellovibrio sp. BCCA TaxID=3136281 RepID=UPI0030F209CD
MELKAKDPEKLYRWYKDNLGLTLNKEGVFVVPNVSPYNTRRFTPSNPPNDLNFQVKDLAELISRLADKGVRIDDHLEVSEDGRFAWIYDPEGNKIELWEAPGRESLINLPEPE